MFDIHRAALTSFIAVLTASTALAQVYTPVSQNRSTSGFVIVPPCTPASVSSNLHADDFQPFDSELMPQTSCAVASGAATSVQHSTIGSSLVTATGGTSSEAAAVQLTTIHAIAFSTFELQFSIAAPRKFRVEGSLAAQRMGSLISVGSSMSLTGPNNAVAFSASIMPMPDGSLNSQDIVEERFVQPGNYTLRASSTTIIDRTVPPNLSGESSYDMQARLAIPGDVNLDETVNLLDVEALVAVLLGTSQDPLLVFGADVNGDGTANGGDVQPFVDAITGS